MDSNGAKYSDGRSNPEAKALTEAPNTAAPVDTDTVRTQRPTTTARRTTTRRKPAAPRRRVGRWLRGALGVLLLFGGLLGIAAFRLSRGPVSLSAFKGMIQSAVDADLGGNTFTMRDAELSLGTNGLDIAFTDIRISDHAGTALVQAPRAAVSLSGQAALRGQLAFSRLELISPRLQFFYADDGTLSVKFAQPADAPSSEPAPQSTTVDASATLSTTATAATAGATAPAEPAATIDFVKALTDMSAQARRREHVTAYLREIGLRQLIMVVDNGHRKTIWRVPEVKIDLNHKASRSLIEGSAVIDSLTGRWALDFQTSEAAGRASEGQRCQPARSVAASAVAGGVGTTGCSRRRTGAHRVLVERRRQHSRVRIDGSRRASVEPRGHALARKAAIGHRQG